MRNFEVNLLSTTVRGEKCDVRVLILLFSPTDKNYSPLGYIPNE